MCMRVVRVVLFASLAIIAFGCNKPNADRSEPIEVLDYAVEEYWFEKPAVEDAQYPVDIFYILPTCVWDWYGNDGVVHHYADVNSTEQRDAMQPSYELAQGIFASGQCNYYAPYYQQISLESWIDGDSVVSERFPYAMRDIQTAFDYFIENENSGRPFILAGYSQGGKGVVELLKTLPEELVERMVAAYVIGYRVTAEDISVSENIKLATSSNDTGVVICYNSVESAEDAAAVLSPSIACINPVNWHTDTTVAALNDTVTVAVDSTHSLLLVKGLNSEEYYLPILSNLFVKGNYHLQELNLYQSHLKANVTQRITTYLNK